MDSDGSQIICIILLIFLVLVKFFYTACEYADIEVNDSKIKSLAEKDKKYQRLSELIGKPVRMIVSFSMGKTVPVSYTHLDVYKRQLLYSLHRISLKILLLLPNPIIMSVTEK